MARILLAFAMFACAVPSARAEPEERARAYLMMRIIDALDLSDEKALAVGGVLRRADARRQAALAKRDDVYRRLRAALDAPAPGGASLDALVAEAAVVDGEIASLPEQSFRDLQPLLTPTEQAKLLLERRAMQDDVRGALRRRWRAGHER